MALEAAFGVEQSRILSDPDVVRAADRRELSRLVRAADVYKERALQDEQLQAIEDAVAKDIGGLRYLRERYARLS
jgi:hypothetical protein